MAVSPWLALPAVAAGVGLVGYKGYRLHQDLQARDAASAAALAGSQRLASIGQKNAVSEDVLNRLRGQRQIASAQIANYEEEHRRGTFKQFWGMTAYSDADRQAIDNLRQHYADLQKQIDGLTTSVDKQSHALDRDKQMREQFATHQQRVLESATAASYVPIAQAAMVQQQQFAGMENILSRVQLSPEQKQYQDAIQTQIEALMAELATIDMVSEATKEQATQDANRLIGQIAGLRGEQRNVQKQQLDLQWRDYGDSLNLMRQQLAIAEATPIGWLGAGKELHEFQAALQGEIERLSGFIKGIDQSSIEGQRQARQYQMQQNQLTLELRQSRVQEMQALLDAAVGQASQAGRYEKVLFGKDLNYGAGLRLGAINYDQRVVGAITGVPTGWGPRTLQQVIQSRRSGQYANGSSDPAVHLRNASQALDKAANAIDSGQDIGNVFPPSTHHPAARTGNVIPYTSN